MPNQQSTLLLVDDTKTSPSQEYVETAERIATVAVQEQGKREAAGTIVQTRHDQHYPPWPTSTAGPQATPGLPGMKPHATRSDQMVYECYDQELGVPCTAVTEAQSVRHHPLAGQVMARQRVYDAQGRRLGKITVCYPLHILVERGLIFRRSYYVPLSLVERVEEQGVYLAESEATLAERGFATAPVGLYHVPRSSGGTVFPDISDASWLGKYPPTPAETGHYHYGPHGPGINTDASGSYAPHEIDPYGQLRDRPVKLYITGKKVHGRIVH
ncbi:MAG: hypothetical protein ABI406_06040 [Ktedonobacteraceae bacterium]